MDTLAGLGHVAYPASIGNYVACISAKNFNYPFSVTVMVTISYY